MKEIHCQVCGSTNILRDDEFYICSSCGEKYSALEIIELTIDVKPQTKTFKRKKTSTNQKYRKHNSLSYYENQLAKNPNNWEATFYSVFLKAKEAKVNEISSSISKINNVVPKSLNLIKSYVKNPNQQLEAIMEISGNLSILGANFKNAPTNLDSRNKFISNQINKEWYLRVKQLSGMYFNFGDEVERIFEGNFREIAINTWKAGIWFNLDIINLAEDKTEHIRKIEEYANKIRIDEPGYDSKLDTKLGVDNSKDKKTSFKKWFSNN